MKYKVGDVVKIKDDVGWFFAGATAKVTHVIEGCYGVSLLDYNHEKGNRGWLILENEIEGFDDMEQLIGDSDQCKHSFLTDPSSDAPEFLMVQDLEIKVTGNASLSFKGDGSITLLPECGQSHLQVKYSLVD